MGDSRDKQQTQPAPRRICVRRPGGRAGELQHGPRGGREGGRSSSPQHLLTPRLPERPEASGACPPPRPGPHTLPEPEPGPAAATGAASARAAGGEAAGSLPVVYK